MTTAANPFSSQSKTAMEPVTSAKAEWDAIEISDDEGFSHHVPFPGDDVTAGNPKKRKAVDEPSVVAPPPPKKASPDSGMEAISSNADWVAYVDKSPEPLLSDFKQRLRSWAQARPTGTTC
jgi:hypothetical protein